MGDLAEARLAAEALSQPRLGPDWLEQLNRIARRVFDERLFAARPDDDVAPEVHASVTEPLDCA